MGEFAIGQSVLRREDPRLLRGQGRYFDDLKLADQLHAAIVRSPHAHADIRGIDTGAARQMPGVHAVLTGADYAADALGPLPSMAPYKKRDGSPMYLPPRPAIAIDRAMHVGYPVAVVVADTLELARDAAEAVTVDYAPRPAVVSARDAFEQGAPQLYGDCPNNEAYFYQAGDKAKTDAAFAGAAHVVEQRLVINRVTANPIEPRGVTGVYDAGTHRYTLHCGFQRPWLFRSDIARTTLKIPEAELRLMTGDIGGSYGLRGSVYPEIILMLWAARKVGRPVKWTQTRNEAHVSDDDARDNIVDAALALDKDGKFLGVRIRSFGNLGAFVSFRGAMPPVVNIGTVVGTYLTPALHVAVSGMLTNTHCTSPYRGAGRPEASYMIERLVDIAADQMNIDPAELRRRNTIAPQAMPYKTPLVFTYDSGHFEENLDRTMKLSDWSGFEARRKEAARRGMLRGIGISNTIEQAADPTIETAEIRFDPLGGLTLVTGSISHGQGHATIQTQILVDRLGIDPERVKFIQGDTDAVAFGMGTGGSRSTTMSGGAIAMVSEKIVAKGTKLAAHLMEAAEGDVEFKDGRFTIAGTDRSTGIHDVAKAAFQLEKLPAGMEPGLYETATYRARSGNFPNGCHVCEVEIDPETGITQMVGYWVTDDVGTVINPMLVKGQIMGGIAQGMGQVLMEDKAYDDAGQVLSGSFMDYAMPRADDFCPVVIEDNPVPTPTNPLGVKGAGEAGTVGSLSAGVNAIVDALSVLGIRHIDTPCTPYRVWQAIVDARSPRLPHHNAMTFDPRPLGIATAGFCAFVNLYSPQALLPQLANEFHVSAGEISALMTAGTGAIALTAPFTGVLADIVGRKRLITAAMFLIVVPTVIMTFATTVPEMVFWRFIQGMMVPPIFTVAVAYIGDEWPASDVARVAGLYMVGSSVGGFSGRFIPGILTDLIGWRAAFDVVALLTLVAAIIVALTLTRERHFVPSGGPLASARYMVRHIRDPRLIATFAIGFGVLFNFVATFTYIGFHLAAPPYSFSATLIGGLFVTYLASSVVVPWVGRGIALFGRRRLVLGIIVAWIFGALLMLLPPVTLILFGLTLCAVCGMLCQTVATGYVTMTAKEGRSSAVGLYASIYYVGGSAGAFLGGIAWSLAGWPGCVATIAAMLVIIAAIVAAAWE